MRSYQWVHLKKIAQTAMLPLSSVLCLVFACSSAAPKLQDRCKAGELSASPIVAPPDQLQRVALDVVRAVVVTRQEIA